MEEGKLDCTSQDSSDPRERSDNMGLLTDDLTLLLEKKFAGDDR